MVHDTSNIALNERELYKAREFVESWGIGERLLTTRNDRVASTILLLFPGFEGSSSGFLGVPFFLPFTGSD
jgi:hypothetical protein